METAFQFFERRGGERVDGAAVAALYFWNHLDWTAVLLQFGGHTFDEGAGAGCARESVSGVDVAGDGVVPVVGAGDRDCGHALLFFVADHRCAEFGESGTGAALVWLVGAGVDGGVRGDLLLAAASEGNSRFGVGSGDRHWRDCDCGFLDGNGAKWRRACVEWAPGDQRRRRVGIGDAVEYLGRGLARAEAVDCVDACGGGAGDALACGSGTHDAMDISYGANVFVAFISDAVFYGGGEPLSVFEQRCALAEQRKGGINAERRAEAAETKRVHREEKGRRARSSRLP